MDMETRRISDKISYIPATESPLSADIGIIRDGGQTWLFDVGSGTAAIDGLSGSFQVVLSHFHGDHTGNLKKLDIQNLYVSGETRRHIGGGFLVKEDLFLGAMHLFPIPSSHCKGCLGLEIDEAYAFVGDALYCKGKNGDYFYSTQLLRDEIAVLKKLKAPCLLVSHHPGLVRSREEVIAELEELYAQRDMGSDIIPVGCK